MAEERAVRSLVERVRATILARRLLKGGETVVVAVSGGPDSLALLGTLVRLADPLDLRLHVAHFDHRLRAASAADAAFVARAASRLGLPSTSGAADATDRPKGVSPEEAARERRYAFLEDVADAIGAQRIATGHTLDDQAETVLMRLLAGAGTRGLAGIPPRRGRIVRPLIDARRAETEAFCRALRLRPRRDATNTDEAFLRNLIRADLLPLLVGRFNARAPEALARLADIAREEDALLDRLAAEAVHVEHVSAGARVAVEALLAIPPALQRRVVRRLAPMSAEHTERVLRMARTGETGDQISLPGSLIARLEYGWLLAGRSPSQPATTTPVALEVPGVTDCSLWSIRMRAWPDTRPPSQWPDGRRTCVLDADRARAPLAVRSPRRGDRFRPLGMSKEKKLGDYFTDAKVPRHERAGRALVVSGDRIVWVIGERIDDRAKVTPRTKRFLWLEAEGGPS